MNNLNKALLSLAIIALLASCNSSEKPKDTTDKPAATSVKPMDIPSIQKDSRDTVKMPEMPKENPYQNAKLDLRISQNADGTWGYSIYKEDGTPYIIQPHIPGVSGTRGFKTQEQAAKAGNFVISKIRKNTGMPMVTVTELDSLGVLK